MLTKSLIKVPYLKISQTNKVYLNVIEITQAVMLKSTLVNLSEQ